MYYVGAYKDEKGIYQFIGWSKNKYAVIIYNTAGHEHGVFYDDYEVFEYDCSKEKFENIVKTEWNYVIESPWEDDDYCIHVYETRHGDCIAITNAEYDSLIAYTDIEYEMGQSYMETLYTLIGSEAVLYIRNGGLVTFIGYLASFYTNAFRGVSSENASVLCDKIDKLQAFMCKIRDDSLMNIY